jgi:hypothetical protein
MEKVRVRNGSDFGWEIAHAAVSRRPPIHLYPIVAHTEGYTYDVKCWEMLGFVQRSRTLFCQAFTIRNFSIAVPRVCPLGPRSLPHPHVLPVRLFELRGKQPM